MKQSAFILLWIISFVVSGIVMQKFRIIVHPALWSLFGALFGCVFGTVMSVLAKNSTPSCKMFRKDLARRFGETVH